MSVIYSLIDRFSRVSVGRREVAVVSEPEGLFQSSDRSLAPSARQLGLFTSAVGVDI